MAAAATLGGSKSRKVSQSLFGVDFTPDQIVDETLERATPEIDAADSSVREAIRAAVASDDGPPSDYEAFRIEPALPMDLLGTYVLLPLLPSVREPT